MKIDITGEIDLDDQMVDRLLDRLAECQHHVLEDHINKAIQWYVAARPSRIIENIEKGLAHEDAADAPIEFEHGKDDENSRMVDEWKRRMTAAGDRMLELWTNAEGGVEP